MAVNKDIDNIQACRMGDAWYAQAVGTSFWGKGATLSAAHDDLLERLNQFEEFKEESGLPAFDVRTLEVQGKRGLHRFSTALRIIVVVALCSIPLSYGISTGIKRGMAGFEVKGGKAFWSKVEREIMKMGAEGSSLTPEKIEALSKALDNIVERARPFTSQLPLLLEPIDGVGGAQPSGKAVNGQTEK